MFKILYAVIIGLVLQMSARAEEKTAAPALPTTQESSVVVDSATGSLPSAKLTAASSAPGVQFEITTKTTWKEIFLTLAIAVSALGAIVSTINQTRQR